MTRDEAIEVLTEAGQAGDEAFPLLEAAIGLMARIHHEFTYATASTDLTTPALEAFSRRQGVCQDFAHLMLACLRAMGLPARVGEVDALA